MQATEEFIQRQRATWDAGDFPEIAKHISDVGEKVVAAAGVETGATALDVACGTGNAALPAARAGASVTGLDLVPKLLEAGRARAAEASVEIEWVEGNAEQLPFADDSFDRVFSTFGHMFAPRHRLVADEMARVIGPGGVIATATWLPDGNVGKFFGTVGKYMPPPPDFAEPPLLWGSEDHVREMFPAATGYEFEREVTTVEWESVPSWFEYFSANFGPLVMARQALGERFEELERDLLALMEQNNAATDGTLRLPQQYLLSVIRF